MVTLSKSKYLAGLQCPKLVWTYFNKPESIPPPDASTQARFDQGHLIGNYAKKWFPDGVEVEWNKEKVEVTKSLIEQKKTIFEAAIIKGDLYAQPDILKPAEGKWDVIEVKSAKKVKDENYEDLAFQAFVFKDKITINKYLFMVLNGDYVRNGDINPGELFKLEDGTEEIKARLPLVEGNVKEIFKAISQPECPHIKIGPQCRDPHECPLIDDCWHLPEHNVTELHNIRLVKALEYMDRGIVSLDDVPPELDIKPQHRIQVEASRTGKIHFNKEGVNAFLSQLKYPLYFLDFESINPAIPLFNGTSPYQQVAFQFSLHIRDSPEAELRHVGFIGEGDPRRQVLDKLKENLGTSGSILVYFQGFENGRFKEMAKWFPEEADWISSVLA
jgi:hypothetical protein